MFLVGYQSGTADAAARRQAADVDPTVRRSWQQAIDRADRLRPARCARAMETIEPATGWATIDCGNPSSLAAVDQRRHRLRRRSAVVEPDGSRSPLRDDVRPPQPPGRGRCELTAARRWCSPPFAAFAKGKQRMEVRFDGVAGCLRTPRGGMRKADRAGHRSTASCGCAG